ncbi:MULTISPECIES: DUF2310 family Zn-ribbon-containing protein [unclassified Rickettsia]|uniref:DUF2310 family Zn-ribbon-containing protein n=1 Tax=unclassified Rickettsia TaxID=114295 RepID=UPI003132DF17
MPNNIYLVTISFDCSNLLLPKKQEEILDLAWSFVAFLYKNGNILKHAELFNLDKTHLITYNVIPNKNALDDNFLDTFALKYRSELEAAGVIIHYNITGEYVNEGMLCLEKNIEDIKFFYLYPLYISDDELILRTDKGKYLPLYMIKNSENPYLTEKITFWKNDYAAAGRLWLSSYKKLEPLIAKQLANLNSDISVEGRKVSEQIANHFNKKVFYPLAELWSSKKRKYTRSNYTQCPSCSKDWQLKKEFHNIFDFKCNKCSLLGYELSVI